MTTAVEVLVVMAAATVTGLTGFGFNVFAVPALALVLPAKDAVVIALVAGAILSSALAATARPRRDLRTLGGLLVASVPGMALGTLLFASVSDAVVQLAVGAVTCGSALLVAARPRREPRPAPVALTAAAGVTSGVLTTLTGTGGPPIVAVLARVLRDPAAIRGLIALYTAVVSTVAALALSVTSSLEPALLGRGALLAMPGLAGLLAGSLLFRRAQGRYRLFAAATLLVMGVLMAVSALRATGP